MRKLLDQFSEIMVHKGPVDMRKSYDGLFKLVKNAEIFEGGIFLFISKNRKRAKVLIWNKKGLMIIMQRMEEGRFADISRRKSLSRDEFLDFFEGSKIISKLENTAQKRVGKTQNNEYYTNYYSGM